MDQRPEDRIPPRTMDPLADDLAATRTRRSWDRVTRTEGDWNFIPLVLVAALIAISAGLLIVSDRRAAPTTKTTETGPPTTAPTSRTPPVSNPNPIASPAPTPATKP
jgi:hypothetical protein